MKFISRQRTINLAIIVLTAVSFSSCNRGYGCPTNFDAGDVISTAINTFASLLF